MAQSKNSNSEYKEIMRKKLLESGSLDSFTESEILEFLLFYTYPRCNASEVAGTLLKRFKTLDDLLSASEEELLKSNCLTDKSAFSLAFVGYLTDYIAKIRARTTNINDHEKMSRYAASFYRREENEKLVVFCADESGRLLAVKELAFGKKTNVEIDIRQISQFALKCGAKQVAIAHNHPGLSGKPSSEDILITNNLRDFLEKIGIKLVEHYVVGCDKVVTLWGDNYIHDTE